MAPTNEQFLFSCINNSNNGTVNWQKVADECGIVSKGAANIKFKRMKEKFGTVAKQAAVPAAPSPEDVTPPFARDEVTPKKTKKTPAKKSTPKKRKIDDDKDDEEEDTKVKPKKEEDID